MSHRMLEHREIPHAGLGNEEAWRFKGLLKVVNKPLPIEWGGMEVRYAQEQEEFEASDEAQNPAVEA